MTSASRVLATGLLLALAAGSAGRAAAQPAPSGTPRLQGWAWAARPLPAAPAPPTHRPPDDWLGRDKALHAAGSFLLTLSAQYVLTAKGGADEDDALPFSAGGALFLGVVKEVADSRRPIDPPFSWKDLAADALGVLLAAGVVSW